MAKSGKLTVAPEPVEDENEEGQTESAAIRVGPMHEAFADFIRENRGVEINAEQVFAVTSSRVAFRKSDGYQVGVKSAKVAAREAAATEKLSRDAEREIEKARKAEERERLNADKEEQVNLKKAEREQAAAEKAAAKSQVLAEKADAAASAASVTSDLPAKKATRAKAKGKSPF